VVLPASGRDADNDALDALRGRFAAADRPVHVLADEAGEDETKIVAAMGTVLRSLPKTSDGAAKQGAPAGAALAILPGFDGRTASAMHAWLGARYDSVAVIAPEAGWVRGMNGTPMRATHRYAEPPALAKGALLVMPGGFWPHSEGQEREKQRIQWVVKQHADAEAHVVAVGLDSYELARLGGRAFKGADVTGTDQVDWAMRGKPVTFKLGEQVIHAAGHRLTTARGFESVPALWQALNAVQAEQ
jgi:putative intracellular protease/amidase